MPLAKTTLAAGAAVAAAAAVAPASAHADHLRLGDRTLVRGHEGSDVETLQRLLTRAGFRTAADGAFGRQTHRNVHRYERRRGLRVDGRVSRGQARGLYRAAGRRVPEDFGRSRRVSTSRPSPGVRRGFPVAGRVTWREGFGTRGGRHQGVDLFAACGTPLVATVDGTIAHVKHHEAAGRYVVLRGAQHDDVYMHMQAVDVEQGATVRTGQRLGTVGATGNATGCHLHFERWSAPGWYRGGEPTDPEPALRAAEQGG